MRWTAFWIFILSGASLVSSAFAAGPFGAIQVENWSGGAFTNDKGAFSHCSAENGYGNGVTVAVVQYSNGNWGLGFGAPSFRLAPGETFPVDVTFDGQRQLHLSGTATSPHVVFAMLPNNTALEQLRKAHLMVAVGKGSTYRFNLDSTEKLLPVIANCVAKWNREFTQRDLE
jgi:hypothetical protein